MIADDELLTSSLAMLGDSQIDDAELDHHVAVFKGALRRLREDPAETARVDAIVADAELGQRISKLANETANEMTEKRGALQGSSMLATPGRSIARVTAWSGQVSMLTSAGQGRGDDRAPFVGLPGSWQGRAVGLWDEAPGPARSGFGFAVEEDGATRLVRPYTVTGGRTQPRYQLAIEALVTATVFEPRDLSVLAPECQAILQFCRDWRSVAEVSAVLRLPLGVARILIADMSADGLVRIHQRDDSEGRPDLHLLERVLRGLRKI
jgi:hypothetical protein